MEPNAERERLAADARGERHWKQWGPYLAERQWGTVREDYSEWGNCWSYLPHDHARSRAYRWGEDGLLGITDRQCRVCFALALWNGRDPILKERLFGLDNAEGNHGEDVKEQYFYVDATPTFSYIKALYRYPLDAFPYADLVHVNAARGRNSPEYELADTGILRGDRFVDVWVEYAKAEVDDILIRITCHNQYEAEATLHVLPTVWLRNTWAWGRQGEGYWPKGSIAADGADAVHIDHPSLGRYRLAWDSSTAAGRVRQLFTENETNAHRLFGLPESTTPCKDAFHDIVINGRPGHAAGLTRGTKAAAWFVLNIPAHGTSVIRLRLSAVAGTTRPAPSSGGLERGREHGFATGFDAEFERCRAEADEFHRACRNAPLNDEERLVARQADAGLLCSQQFYHYVIQQWLDGDPAQPAPSPRRKSGRNHRWSHVHACDVLSMPDKWEYPWFAAWDLAFHCVALARVDPFAAKQQLVKLCREWYMHPNGQLPAYEFAFGDVNPPVHAWAALRVYQLAAAQGYGHDRLFLESVFQKCLVNFTWWVNRLDTEGDNLFSGGFLGLDNISIFDRSQTLPRGGRLEQADGTAWMAFFCTTMLAIAMELSAHDPAYCDIAAKFFEHFFAIAQAMNSLGGTGLWSEEDGFYYDLLLVDGTSIPLRLRSIVGIIPLFAAETLDARALERLPHFRDRHDWFLANRPDVTSQVAFLAADPANARRLLAIPSRDRLERVLAYVLDEREFLSPFGVRSLSRVHAQHPWSADVNGERLECHYVPGESDSGLFGGNSNWRGPIWFPVNYLLIDALKRLHHFYKDDLTVECPTGSGVRMTLLQVAEELESRLARLFMPDSDGVRPAMRGLASRVRTATSTISCCSTSTSTATMGVGWGRVTRPAGRR